MPIVKCWIGAAVAAGLVLGATIATARAEDFSPTQRAEMERIIRSYLLDNPQVIVEAMERLRAREERAEDQARRQALIAHRDRVFDNPNSPTVGNPNGSVTVVEFFDYQCGYCKAVRQSIVDLLHTDDDVRVVFKEFPILGPGSTLAARAALASRAQDLYWDFHNELMKHRGRLNVDVVFRLGTQIGLDIDRLKADMEAPEINRILEENLSLADALSIRGTPAFIIGDEIVPGAINLENMRRLINEAREAS